MTSRTIRFDGDTHLQSNGSWWILHPTCTRQYSPTPTVQFHTRQYSSTPGTTVPHLAVHQGVGNTTVLSQHVCVEQLVRLQRQQQGAQYLRIPSPSPSPSSSSSPSAPCPPSHGCGPHQRPLEHLGALHRRKGGSGKGAGVQLLVSSQQAVPQRGGVYCRSSGGGGCTAGGSQGVGEGIGKVWATGGRRVAHVSGQDLKVWGQGIFKCGDRSFKTNEACLPQCEVN